MNIWPEFIALLRAGPLPPEKMRPYFPALAAPLAGFLEGMRKQDDWTAWENLPEMHTIGSRVHFLLPQGGEPPESLCLTFLVEDDHWYFQHAESILIRLDQVTSFPASSFPDLPEAQKAWMREELRITEEVRLFHWLSGEKGRSFALDWFRDGAGYALAARTWVPLLPPQRALVLYLCWEQANLRGSPAALLHLDDRSAAVRLEPAPFRLYRQTGHLRSQIGFSDLRELFETVWRDRLAEGGWQVRFEYEAEDGTVVRLDLERDGHG